MHLIKGDKTNREKRIAEINAEMKDITNMMYKLASGKNYVLKTSRNGVAILAKALRDLMDEKSKLEKPVGLNEIKASVANLIDIKTAMESGVLELPDGLMPLVENAIIRLTKERMRLEKRLEVSTIG